MGRKIGEQKKSPQRVKKLYITEFLDDDGILYTGPAIIASDYTQAEMVAEDMRLTITTEIQEIYVSDETDYSYTIH